MRAFILIFIVLAIFLWKPELLYAFDTMSGRILMLLVVVYLLQYNVVLGFMSALVVIRVLDHEKDLLTWKPSTDLMYLETLLRPKDSAFFPTLRTTDVPLNDVYEPFTLY